MTSEQTRLLSPEKITKVPSYGGQSSSSSVSIFQEDYGDYNNPQTVSKSENPSWVDASPDIKGDTEFGRSKNLITNEKNIKGEGKKNTLSPKKKQGNEEQNSNTRKDQAKERIIADTYEDDTPRTNGKPIRSTFHSIFIMVQILAILGLLCLSACEIVPVYTYNLQLLESIVRCYLTLFSLVFILLEIEVPCLMNHSLLENWVFRGFLYTFLGVVAMQQRSALASEDMFEIDGKTKIYLNAKIALLFVNVSSWWMISVGTLYFLFGIFCLKKIRDRCREKYQSQLRCYNTYNDAING